MLLKIYEKGILTFKTVALYFHTITAFLFIISQGHKIGNKKRAVDNREKAPLCKGGCQRS